MKKKFLLMIFVFSLFLTMGGGRLYAQTENGVSNTNAETVILFEDDFNSLDEGFWTQIDANGDGKMWYLDKGCIVSKSYYNTAIDPEDYIVTTSKYKLSESSELTLKIGPNSSGYNVNAYSVVISEDKESWTTVYGENFRDNNLTSIQTRTISLSDHSGKTVHVGVLHHFGSAEWGSGVKIDYIKLTGVLAETPAAKIGDVKYADLASAIDAAQAGETVTLLRDINLGDITSAIIVKKSITIDGEGYWTITVNSVNDSWNSAAFAPRGPISYTFKNLTIDLKNAASNMAAFNMKYGGTLENVTVKGAFAQAVSVSMAYPVTVTNCKFDGATWGVYASGSGVKLNVTGTTFNTAGAVYMHQYGELVFTDNIVAADSYIETAATVDVSKNFWNGNNATGSAPTAAQLKGDNIICDTYYATNANGVLGGLTNNGVAEDPVIEIVADGETYKYGSSKLSLISKLLGSSTKADNVNITLLDNIALEDGMQIAPYIEDVTLAITPKNVEIDLNGKTLNGFIQVNANVTATIKNGTITAADNTYPGVDVAGKVTLDKVTINAANDVRVSAEAELITSAKVGKTYYATLAEAFEAAVEGDVVRLLINTTFAEELTTPAGITIDGNGKQINGTIYAGGNLTFVGHTKVTAFSASYYNHVITIGEGACLEITGTGRVTLGYGNTFNITGSIENAKTADKANVQASLIIPAGISITGGNDAAMNVTNAYVQIGSTTSKNSAANGTFTLNFTNSIAEFTNQLTFAEPTSGKTPEFNLNITNSVLTTATKLCVAAPNTNVIVDNSNVTLATYFRNSGNVTIKNGSAFTGKTIQFGENGGNNGTITVDASALTITAGSEGHAFDGKGIGKVILMNEQSTATLDFIKDMSIETVDNHEIVKENNTYKAKDLTVVEELGTWGGIDWSLTRGGTLTIAPTAGEPVADKNAPTKRTYEVGEWREAVVYKSNGSASAIGGYPYDVKKVKTLVIEEGVTKIGSFTAQFPNLTGEVVIPSTVEYIGQEAFSVGSKNTTQNITKITFAAGGTAPLCIANGAFKYVEIEEVSFPGDREYIHIHHWAFGDNYNLKRAYIPANVTKSWGGEHVDYFDNFNSQSNVTWAEKGSIFTGCTAMETITFETKDVRDLFFANNRQSTEEDYIVAAAGLVAYNTIEKAIAAATDGGDILLVKNTKLEDTWTIPAGMNLTLDLNGKTISQSKACTASYSMIENNGELIVTGNGKISFTDTGAGDPSFGWGSYTITNRGTLVVENGTIEHKGAQAFGTHCIMAIFQYSGSTTINGGTISTPNYRSVRLWKGDMTINGGTFDGQLWVQAVDNSANLTINGGTFEPNGNDASAVFVTNNQYNVALAVTDGTFNGKIGCSDATKLAGCITGGKFSAAAKENTASDLIAMGYVFGAADADSYFSVVDDPTTHYINNVADLKAFRDDVNSGKNYAGVTVYLTANIDLEEEDWTPITKFNGTFDGQNHTISNLWVTGTGNLGFFKQVADQTETVTGTVKNVTFENVTIVSSDAQAGLIADARLGARINNVNLTGEVTISGYRGVGSIVGAGFPVIENCKVEAEGTITATYWGAGGILGFASDKGAKAINSTVIGTGEGLTIFGKLGGVGAVTGTPYGAATNGATIKNVVISSTSNYCMGYVDASGNVTNVTVENVAVKVNGTDVVGCDAVAVIGTTPYFDFATAMNNADGKTVTLFKDVEVNSMIVFRGGKNVTIEGEGKTITFNNTTYGFGVVESTLTLGEGLNIVANGKTCPLYVQNGTAVTSANISTTEENGFSPIMINGGYRADITINGGNIVSNNPAVSAIYWPGEGNLTIKGGTITGPTAVYFKSGNLTITGGEIIGNGAKADYGYVVSGSNPTGDALVIENVGINDYEAIGTVSITGGTFTSVNAAPIASYTAGNEGVEAVAGFVSGGTFNKAIAPEFCAQGYICKQDGTTYTVVDDPSTHYINNVEELKAFRDAVNAGNTYAGITVYLAADIDLNTTRSEESNWTPIGTSANPFKGTFDGQGHTISNLVINGGSNSNQGFFGTTQNGEIKNVTFNNAKVSGRLNVGVVAGQPYTSKYTNVKVTGHVEVNGMAYVGGVGGKNAYANWTDITVDVDATSYVEANSVENGTAYRTYVGGVVGFNGEGGHTFTNISSNIKVIGSTCDIGGVFGIAHYNNKFENITFTGAVEAPADAEEVGGIAGVWHNEKGTSVTFTGCTSTGTVTIGEETTTGSIVGAAYNAANETADNSGKLIIDGEEVWLKVAKVDGIGYRTLAAAIEAAEEDATITMLADVELTSTVTIPAGKVVTLDLNGKTISAAIAEQLTKSFAAIQNKGTLTVKDSATTRATGKITVSYAGASFGYGVGLYTISNEGGTLNIESGIVENTTTVSGSMYDAIDNNSTTGNTVLNILGGEVKCQYIGVRQFANSTTYENIVNVTAGRVEGGNTSIWMQNPGSSQPKATIAISDDAYITGRLLAGESTGFVFNVTGGTFTTDVTAFCADNFSAVLTGPNTWVVKQTAGELTRTLPQGWSWFSSYVNISGAEGLATLEDALGENGVQIKDEAGKQFAQYSTTSGWYGNLTEASSTKMYSIRTSAAVEVSLEGEFFGVENYEPVLRTGWNYISYPHHEAIDLATALRGFTPVEGDVIKSKKISAIYTSEGWFNAFELNPGEGFMYRSNAANKQVAYTTEDVRSTSRSFVSEAPEHWTADATQYPGNMTMIATLDVEGADYEVAAFVDGEVRGSARPIYVDFLDQYIVVMTINGEDVANVTFKYYDLNAAEVYDLNNVVVYSDNAILGSIESPYALTRGTTGIDESSINSINIYPNPTTTDREINLQATCDKVEVFNTLGVKVAEYQNVDSIDALETAGTYVIRVTLNGDVKHCRLIVK